MKEGASVLIPLQKSSVSCENPVGGERVTRNRSTGSGFVAEEQYTSGLGDGRLDDAVEPFEVSMGHMEIRSPGCCPAPQENSTEVLVLVHFRGTSWGRTVTATVDVVFSKFAPSSTTRSARSTSTVDDAARACVATAARR